MNATVTTILGTAALGLIKSKMGSGLRLKNQVFMYLEDTIAIVYDSEEWGMLDKQKLKEFIRKSIYDYEPTLREEGFRLDKVEFYDWSNTYYGNITKYGIRVRYKLSKLFFHPDYPNNSIMIADAEAWDVGEPYELWGLLEEEIPFYYMSNRIVKMIEEVAGREGQLKGDDFEWGWYEEVVNADTGEKYTVSEPKKPKIRRR